jgi:NADH-quinone oxidoreductase subunit E
MIEPKEVIKLVNNIVGRNGNLLISVLEDVQEQYNYLPEEILREVSHKMKIPLRDVYGVATFYSAFSLKPKGKHIVIVCMGTACHVRGGARIVDSISNKLGIQPGETTADKNFSLETVNCLGCCAIGPIVLLDGVYHGEMTPQKTIKLLDNITTEKKNDKVKVSKRLSRTAS